MSVWHEWSYHGYNAGTKSIKRIACELGKEINDEKAKELLCESEYHRVKWVMDKIKELPIA